MDRIKKLLENNKQWQADTNQDHPGLFDSLANQQSPEVLWIGCADSRVPPNQITKTLPGDLFVHRNIANVVVRTDLNCLSVMQYAVEVLRVKDIVICGHYGCGGVKAAMSDGVFGLIDNWLRNIKDVVKREQAALAKAASEEEKFDLMCELNVKAQVLNVCRTTIVQGAWDRGQSLGVHGLIYAVGDGKLIDLDVSVSNKDQLDALDRYGV